jgi:predicted nucleic acid-binding protein
MRRSQPRVAVSNTGPLISALQCGRFDVLQQFYDIIHIPAGVRTELADHGARLEVQELIRTNFLVVHEDLTTEERAMAEALATTIASSPKSRNKNPEHHRSEAEAIALMGREGLEAIELLLDEAAAREMADQRDLPIIGFPGILIRACGQGLISPEAVREALLDCRKQGTHYGSAFIERIYERVKEEAR